MIDGTLKPGHGGGQVVTSPGTTAINGVTVPKPLIAAGNLTTTSVGGVNYAITFGVTFAAPPVVVVAGETTTPYLNAWTISSITTTGCIVSLAQSQPVNAFTPLPAGTVLSIAFIAIGAAP